MSELTDKELLELAAKFVNFGGEYCEFTLHPSMRVIRGIGNPNTFNPDTSDLWNPLDNYTHTYVLECLFPACIINVNSVAISISTFDVTVARGANATELVEKYGGNIKRARAYAVVKLAALLAQKL